MPSSIKTSSLSLSDALAAHVLKQNVSFHTPGHKGFSWQADGSFSADASLQKDLSESVPGLDELAYPSGVIQDLENRAAKVWGTQSSLISVNGATAGIIASILLLAKSGTHLLLPRNCHRSFIQGLILSGLEPIWFEPEWQSEWGLWGPPDISALEKVLHTAQKSAHADTIKIAGVIIVSPTYAGALADVKSLSKLTDKYKIPLIVDEAHGAHLLWSDTPTQSALLAGASIVIHSLHKTLSCPTQTGIVHITSKGEKDFGLTGSDLRACLNLIQSSSPSYLFMDAIDNLVVALNNGKAQEYLQKVEVLGNRLKTFMDKTEDISLYKANKGTIASDILIKHKFLDAHTLQNLLVEKGIFSEAILGQGLLFFLGIGSQTSDIERLETALQQIIESQAMGLSSLPSGHFSLPGSTYPLTSGNRNNLHKIEPNTSVPKPKLIDQVLSPRKAFFMPSHTVSTEESIGQIAAECFDPCPPGWTILVPGQRITDEILAFANIKSVRIVQTNSQIKLGLR